MKPFSKTNPELFLEVLTRRLYYNYLKLEIEEGGTIPDRDKVKGWHKNRLLSNFKGHEGAIDKYLEFYDKLNKSLYAKDLNFLYKEANNSKRVEKFTDVVMGRGFYTKLKRSAKRFIKKKIIGKGVEPIIYSNLSVKTCFYVSSTLVFVGKNVAALYHKII